MVLSSCRSFQRVPRCVATNLIYVTYTSALITGIRIRFSSGHLFGGSPRRIWWRFLRLCFKLGAVCSPALTTEQEESAFPAVGVKIQKRRLMNLKSSALPFFSQMTQCGREFTTSAEPILSVGLSFEDNAYPFILIFLWLYKRDFTLKLLFINDIHWIVEKILWL